MNNLNKGTRTQNANGKTKNGKNDGEAKDKNASAEAFRSNKI